MRTRPVRTFVAWTCTVFVFILFAFPNYCDRCKFRDVARLLAQKQDEAYIPSCCSGKGRGSRLPGRDGRPIGSSSAGVPYCIGKTLSSITEHRDIVAEIRLTLTPSPYRPVARIFARLSPLFDHKDSRGPPA